MNSNNFLEVLIAVIKLTPRVKYVSKCKGNRRVKTEFGEAKRGGRDREQQRHACARWRRFVVAFLQKDEQDFLVEDEPGRRHESDVFWIVGGELEAFSSAKLSRGERAHVRRVAGSPKGPERYQVEALCQVMCNRPFELRVAASCADDGPEIRWFGVMNIKRQTRRTHRAPSSSRGEEDVFPPRWREHLQSPAATRWI